LINKSAIILFQYPYEQINTDKMSLEMKKKIKLFDPMVGIQEEKAVLRTLKSHFWASGSGVGTVSKFEEKFRQYVDSNYCVAVNSGTAALHLALSLADIKNKEVILPSLSFVSTAHAVIYNGGLPIFVDVESNTLCIDPEKAKKSITNSTKVILPVHFGGMSCKLNELKSMCDEHEIILIEDAAHAVGTTYENKRIGCHGMAVCFSFHPIKNLAMPTGGAITLNGANSKKQKNLIESLRWCGISNRHGTKYDVTKLGWNYYMNEFSATIGLIQLSKLENSNKKRKEIAKRYSEEISFEYKMPFSKDCSYHLYWICTKHQMKFIKEMNRMRIETGIHYHPIHKMSYYRKKEKLPITEKIGNEIVSIPIHPNLKESDVDYIIKTVNQIRNKNNL